ncbi:MAG: hypothetical protein AABX11_05825 [Nanoarchaeota archaeon]
MTHETIKKKRSKYSEPEAIMAISRFGISNVIEIGADFIIERYIPFTPFAPTLDQLAELTKRIHRTTHENKNLVHGDLGFNNATVINTIPKCFDYEHAHFGNLYADLGRILLRCCKSDRDVESFFDIYSGRLPDLEVLRGGLIYFCEWQNLIRSEKKLPFSEVPLKRRERLVKTRECLKDILKAFKDPVL